MAVPKNDLVAVSVVMTVHNAAQWLEETLGSIHSQTFTGSMELSVFDDASTDATLEIVRSWQPQFEKRNIRVVTSGHGEPQPKGAGYGRNQAIRQSSGHFLCIFDADDVMAPNRIERQFTVAQSNPDTLLGSCFTRHPRSSTERYTRWCNTLSQPQLYTQAFTAFGPTIIQPTWFFAREVFDRAGPFSEEGQGTPEDLKFFYKLLSVGGKLLRVDEPLLVYRYHENCASFGVDRLTIWKLRVEAIQDFVLPGWKHFTIWNAGKQGRRFYRSLRLENQAKVLAFCDVDQKKISRRYYTYEESQKVTKPRVPIIHFTEAKSPFVLCVKWDLTGGGFEANLASLNLKEGEDYYHFS